MPTGKVAHLRRVVDDLVESQEGEVPRHDLHDWSQPEHRHPDGRADKPQLGDGSVHDARGTIPREQISGNAKGALVHPNIFAQQEDVRIPIHLGDESRPQCVAVGQFGHEVTPDLVSSLRGRTVDVPIEFVRWRGWALLGKADRVFHGALRGLGDRFRLRIRQAARSPQPVFEEGDGVALAG